MGERTEITPTIRVLNAGARGWAVWDDCAEECALYSTEEQALFFARQLAAEQEAEREIEDDDQPKVLSLYDQADRATGAERKRLLRLAALAGRP